MNVETELDSEQMPGPFLVYSSTFLPMAKAQCLCAAE